MSYFETKRLRSLAEESLLGAILDFLGTATSIADEEDAIMGMSRMRADDIGATAFNAGDMALPQRSIQRAIDRGRDDLAVLGGFQSVQKLIRAQRLRRVLKKR